MIRTGIQRGLLTSVSSAAIMLGTLVAPAVSHAQVAEVPYSISNDASAWTVDRSDVASFGNTSWEGRDNVLHLNITPPANPLSFYNWQGYSQQTNVPAGDSFLRGDIWIDPTWTSGGDTDYVRTGMWGSALPEGTVAGGSYVDSEAVFPIISFTNQDGNGRLEVWDTTANPDSGWVNLTETGDILQYGGWNTFDMRLLPDSDRIEYYVNGSLIYTWEAPRNSEDGLSDQYFAAYLQGRNNGVTSFDTYWSQLRSGLVIADGGEIGDTPGDILLTGATGTAFVATGATINGTVVADSGSDVTLVFSEDASVSTNNAGAHGVSSTEGGTVSLEGGTVATNGAGAHGLYAEGDGSTINASGTTVVTTSKGADAVVANGEGSSINLTSGTISTDYRRGPGGGNAGINTHALLAVNGGLITGSDLVISGSNDGYFDGVVSVKAGSEIALSNSTISNEMPYSDFSAAGATADGDGAVLRLDGTSVSVISNKGTIGSSAGAIGVTNGGTVYINQGADAVPAGERDQIVASGNWVRGIVAANGAGNLVDASNIAITTDGANAYGVHIDATGDGTSSFVTLANSSITTGGSQAHAVYVHGDDGGLAQFTGRDLEISTSGSNAAGISIIDGGYADLVGGTIVSTGAALLLTGADSSADVTDVSLTRTTGSDGQSAVEVSGGAQLILNGGEVVNASTSNRANGISAQGAGTIVTASGTNVETHGQYVTSGELTRSVEALDGAMVTLTDGTVSYVGVEHGRGLFVAGGATITTDGTDVVSTGYRSHAVHVWGDGEANLSNGRIETTGFRSFGLFAQNDGAQIVGNGLEITTSGDESYGASASGTNRIDLTDTSISTSGAEALGLVLADSAIGSLVGSTVTTSGNAAHAVVLSDGATLAISGSTLRAMGDGASGVVLENDADLSVAETEIISSGATLASSLMQAGQAQDIVLADGVVAIENDGTLLRINRNVDGADGIVDLRLSGGTNAAGDILDLDAKAGNGHSTVSVTTGAQYAGLIDGVRSLDATGGTAILADGSALERVTAGADGVIEATNVTLRTSGKGEDAAVADGGNIQINGGTISTDYRRGPGGGNAGINTHALLAVNGGLITGSDLVISGSNDGYFDGVVSVKAGSEIALSNSTISNEMPYSDFSAAGATADGDGAVLRLDGTSVSVISNKGTIGSSAGAIGVTNGGTVYINQGADAVPAGERDQIAASGNWVRGIVAANGVGNLVDASNVTITTNGANAYGVQVGAGGTDTGSSVVLHFSGIQTAGANSHGVYVASSDGGPALFTAEGVDIETTGQNAYGVVADGAGSLVTLAEGTVTTAGDWTYGLVARGAGSRITSSADVTTAGEWAFGAYADDGAQITLAGGTVTTNGFRAHGLLAEDGATIDSAANVVTLGDRAHGVQAGSYGHGDSTITLTGGSVSTAGSGAYGLLAAFGGSITGVADIHTVGDGSFGASADGDGYINLTGGHITTEGNGSHGLLVVYDDRAQAAGVLDANVNITTSGANAVGVLALDGGTANLTGGTIATTGVDSFGIAAAGAFPGTTSSPSSVTADQLTITTSGAGAHGFVLADAAIGSLGNSSVVTHGEAAHAVSVADGATITVANATLQATGTDSSGVAMQNSADVTIADTEIISSGATFASSLTQAGQVQNITLASGVVAVENNGTLLLINRTDDGGDGVVNFHLEAGSTTKGDILDLDTKTEGYSSVTIASGADFAGRVKGVRDYQSAPGSSTSFDEKAEIEGDVTASGSSYAFSDEGAEIGGNVSLENGSSTTGGTIENRIHVAGNVNSDDTSRMGGNWQIDGDLNSSGTTTPGNSIGIDSVSGDLNLGATHVYEAEVNQLGQSDLIEVGGIAYLDGSVETSALGGYLVHTPYTILTADGGFAGTEFQNVTWAGGNVFVAPVLSYDPNTVYLSFERSSASFAQLGSTANQQAAARGLDGYGFGNNLVKTLAFAPTAQAPAALDQLSGEVHASAKAALVEESHFLRDAVGSHLRAAFNGDDAAGAAAGSWWGYGFGSWSRFDSTAETARVKSSVGGFLMGIDGALAQNWRLGLVGGYSRTSLHIDDRASSATSNNYHLGIYTGADVDGVNLSASVAHTWHKLKTRRSVAFDTFSDPSLADDYNARTLQAFGEVSYNLGKDDLVLMPYANLAYVRLHANDRLEKGGEAALGAASQNMETLFTTLGMKLSSSFDLGGVQAKPSGRFGWRHAFNDISSDARQHFVDASDFTVQGAPIAKDAATIEAGVDFAVSTRATLGISYQGQFGSGVQENGLKAMLDVRF